MSDEQKDPFDELLRRSLRAEADRIEPSDALPEIRVRAHAQRPSRRRPWLVTVGVAAAGTAAAIGAFTVFNGSTPTANDGDAVAGPGTTATASGVPETPPPTVMSAEPSPVPTDAVKTAAPTVHTQPEQTVRDALVPVYWLGTQIGAPKRQATRLYRTWTKVTGRPAEQAVRVMTTRQPEDPDYFSVWRGAAVNTVTRTDDVVTVDFKQLPKARLTADDARVATQQLVYTVQGALKDYQTPVQVTEGGRPVSRLFGQIDATEPLGRAQAADVQALVWIDSPSEAQALEPRVTVQGVAAADEAVVNYEAVNLKTKQVQKSFAKTSEGQTFAPYSFQLKLSPGPWEISVYLVSAADGRITNTDSKSVLIK